MTTENDELTPFDPDDPTIQAIRQRMVPGSQVCDLPQYPAEDVKKGQKYAIALPRWISGNCDQPMYDICIATEDMKGKGGPVFKPYIFQVATDANGEIPKPDMDKIDKLILGCAPARTRPIKSNARLLTDWQTDILEIMEANHVPDETIGKVMDLL